MHASDALFTMWKLYEQLNGKNNLYSVFFFKRLAKRFLIQTYTYWELISDSVLTSSRRRTSKNAQIKWCRRSESVLTRIPIFASFVGRLVNTPLVACHRSGWRVYTPTFLGVMSTTVEWLRTNGTANNELVHSFCWFLPNPFIEHLLLCQTSQEFVKTDLYPLYRGLLIYVGDTVFSTVYWSMGWPLIGAWLVKLDWRKTNH